MKLLLLFGLFALVFCDKYEYVIKYLDVPLDHFSFTNNATFKLRYLINDSYYVTNRPILFYTGNEGDITNFAQNTGFVFELGKKFGSLIVFAEHRFYGETLPFGNESYNSPTNLGYLSSQQALADYVYLINDLQRQYQNTTSLINKLPVVAFGGSYGGMLAAWLRMKYPYAVIGAIASSAPIWQFKNLTPCENFFKITTDVVRSVGSKTCVNTIEKSWRILREQTNTTDGKAKVSKQFKLCKTIESEDDINTFLDWLEEIYVNLVMVNYPYPTNFLSPLPGYPVKAFCNAMDSIVYKDDDGLLEAIATGIEVYTNYTKTTKCNDILLTSPSLGELGWNFQSCTDMIMPMCSTDSDMFENEPWDFQKYSDNCFKQFSIRPVSEDVPILEYGGNEIETATNIVFSNGLLDPWSSGGVMKNFSTKIRVIIIPDAAHHFDLRGSNELDTDSVKQTRKFHELQIKRWLTEYYFRKIFVV